MLKKIFVLLICVSVLAAAGCGGEKVPGLTDEEVLGAIREYCFSRNPDLKEIVEAGEYTVYWMLDTDSDDGKEISVLFRSYTGAQEKYYTDRATGETYVTEFVPGITDEEQRTEESFNVRDYLGQ